MSKNSVMSEIDFLGKNSTKSIQRELRNIINSYSHPWDIIAELMQNAVDAITKWNKDNPKLQKQHSIHIEINQQTNSIMIGDSGCGFDPNKVAMLLAPNETDKIEEGFIGEKGVGLTFCIFSSNYFKLTTQSMTGSCSCEIRNAGTWVNAISLKEGDLPKIIILDQSTEKSKPHNTFSEICLQDIQVADGCDLFEMSLDRIIYLLRTKTAIGYTGKIFNKGDLQVQVTVKLTTKDGRQESKDIPFEYYFPDQFFNKKDIIDIRNFEQEAATLSDVQKSKRLNKKCLQIIGTDTILGRTYHFFAFFVPTRDVWQNIGRKYKLMTESNDKDKDEYLDIVPGIFISSKGMPTGIQLTPPASGVMGYWENMFILIENDSIKFDIGRKSIPGRSQPALKDIAKDKFSKLTKWKQWLAKEKSPELKEPEISEMERKKIFRELHKLPNLSFDKIKFLKHPADQEAIVVAIFHELIGADILKGYYGLSEGYKKNYDYWGCYKINTSLIGSDIQKSLGEKSFEKEIVIEFKFDAASIIEDVKSNRKFFIDMDLLVCWDIDERAFAKEMVSIEPIPPDKVLYYGSNYWLEFPGTYDLGQQSKKPILSIKQFIDDLKRHE